MYSVTVLNVDPSEAIKDVARDKGKVEKLYEQGLPKFPENIPIKHTGKKEDPIGKNEKAW